MFTDAHLICEEVEAETLASSVILDRLKEVHGMIVFLYWSLFISTTEYVCELVLLFSFRRLSLFTLIPY
jgi:hypothetical protein